MKLTFNKQNIGMKGTVEFELLEEYEKDLDNAKELVKVMERRYNDLYARMALGEEVPRELVTKVTIMKEEMED